MNKGFVDYFLLLEVHMLASDESIKMSYRRLSAKFHPDNDGDTEMYIQVQEAYKTLSNSESRNKYIDKWKNKYIFSKPEFKQYKNNFYDISLNSVREIGNEYMMLIMNKEYTLAYDLLSQSNKETLFINDFVKWQSLVSEVHELLDFECVVDDLNMSNDINQGLSNSRIIVTLKIRIVEMNLLLNRIEEDFFTRDMVYENLSWKVFLPNMAIKNIIKKYKQIIKINKKNKKLFSRNRLVIEDRYLTKKLTMESFMNNAEYEFFRYERYNNVFSIMWLKIDHEQITSSVLKLSEQHIQSKTRKLDSYCLFEDKGFLVLLPETNKDDAIVVQNKMKELFITRAVTVKSDCKSLKSLINNLIIME